MKAIASPLRLAPRRNQALHGQGLQLYIARTYYALRVGMLTIATALPLALLIGGRLAAKGPQPASISGYYHTAMRNLLVGALIAVGTFLVLYRGYGKLENWLLNIAGLAAAGVAFLPTSRGQGATDDVSTFTNPRGHGICALIAFGGIGFTAVFCGSDTVHLLPQTLQDRFRRVYRGLGLAMIVLPLSVALSAHRDGAWVFWTEWAALWIFAAYWAVKTLEIRVSQADATAVTGRFQRESTTSSASTANAEPGSDAVTVGRAEHDRP